nr:PHP domain-containing protein [Deinococcota bacterium]
LADGSLDYPDEVLSKLDYLVASVHSHFGLSEEEQTARIVRAVKNPYTGILGHATGRLLLRRPPYPVDVQAVIEACAQTGTVVEINANPYRLDLDWRWVKRAKALGCTFSINPDAHHVEGLDLVRYGVMMARKAGLQAQDVVNTAPTAEGFLSRLKARP